jgi:mRNA-degrading endonuclease toxin of MazEF toxin-antitoxin module
MGLADALKQVGFSSFSGVPGDVWLVEDADVVIPETKRENRKLHPNGRTCVILSNDTLCADPMYTIVVIAPTSHRVDLKDASDFPIFASGSNGLRQDTLIMLGHVQPVRKSSLFRKIGFLSLKEWEEMLNHLVWTFDRG